MLVAGVVHDIGHFPWRIMEQYEYIEDPESRLLDPRSVDPMTP